MNINKKLIKYNFSSRGNTKIQYIVIHDTGNTNKGAGANNHYLYFNGGNRNASAHYFVDDKEILQLVEDTNSAWHVGDGKGRYGITNSNSIGIEICVNSDGDYAKAVQKTVELTAYLMNKHNIHLNKIVRHYDASRKNCPASMNKNNWEPWNTFKVQLERKLNNPSGTVKLNILGQDILASGYFKNNTNYIKIENHDIPVRDLANALNLKNVTWDNTNKVVIMK